MSMNGAAASDSSMDRCPVIWGEDPPTAGQRGRRTLQPVGVVLPQPGENRVGQAGRGQGSVDAEGPVQDPGSGPPLDDLRGPTVVPENRRSGGGAPVIDEPAAVPLG